MSAGGQINLNVVWKAICNEVKPYHITPLLMQKKVISDEQCVDILSRTTSEEQMHAILTIIQMKGLQALKCFVESLRMASPTYDHIIAFMNNSLKQEPMGRVAEASVRDEGERSLAIQAEAIYDFILI